MKLHKKFILILIVVFSVSFWVDSMQAQGIYSKNKDSEEKSSSSPILRGRPGGGDPPPDTGDGGTPGGPGGSSTGTPIGEGWLILTILSGGYALLQKRKTKKTI
jgi:hypothetical protein